MKIDAHQHYWKLERGDYGWLTPDLTPIYRDFAPADLSPHLTAANIDGTILVQAAPSIAETDYMLSLADKTPSVKGVVGWVDFEDPDAPQHISRLATHPALVAMRPMIQDIPEPDWMLGDALHPAYMALISHDLTLDALILPRHLKHLHTLLARYPNMRTVINHAAKPHIKDTQINDWAADMATLAKDTNAYCKLSGLVTEAADNWSIYDLKPYVDHLIQHFGPDRLIWGSDWPVCTLAASYVQWLKITEILLAGLNTNERASIMGLNATRAYNLRD